MRTNRCERGKVLLKIHVRCELQPARNQIFQWPPMPNSTRSMHQSYKAKIKTNTRLQKDQTGKLTGKICTIYNTGTTCFIDPLLLHRDLPKPRSPLLVFMVATLVFSGLAYNQSMLDFCSLAGEDCWRQGGGNVISKLWPSWPRVVNPLSRSRPILLHLARRRQVLWKLLLGNAAIIPRKFRRQYRSQKA